MMNTLFVLFTGLCAFVPTSPLETGGKTDFTVYLVDGDYISPPHVATIVIKEDYLAPPVPPRCSKVTTPGLNGNPVELAFYRCDLEDGEHVTFGPRGHEAGVEAAWEPSSIHDPFCPTKDNRGDLYWIANMDRMTGGHGAVEPDALAAPNLVKASVSLRDGALKVADFSRIRPHDQTNQILSAAAVTVKPEIIRNALPPRLWSVDAPRPGKMLIHALADLVEYTKKSHENPYLEISRHGDKETIRLVPNGDDQVFIEIKNSPADYLCSQDRQPGKGDFHFSYFYRLLDYHPGLGGLDFGSACKTKIGLYEHYLELCRPPESRLNDPQCPTSLLSSD